jgi:DNA adenine methylase
VNELFIHQLRPWLKWPGGKSGELQIIKDLAPRQSVARFIEPFVGGGSVLLSVNPRVHASANDLCPELIHLYRGGGSSSESLREQLQKLADAWRAISSLKHSVSAEIRNSASTRSISNSIRKVTGSEIDLLLKPLVPDLLSEFHARLMRDTPKKIDRILKLEIKHQRELPIDELVENVHGSIHSSFYMSVRNRYNQSRSTGQLSDQRAADFFFLREYSYAAMFRFNAKGEFNVPYGGISYNKKDFNQKIESLYAPAMRLRLENTDWQCQDFSQFLEHANPMKDDFIFVDPPYDSEFSDYDNKVFDSSDQRRLAELLNELESKVMIVIGDTPLVRELYSSSKWNFQENLKLYNWTIKNRNDRSKNHLTIRNYL